MSGSFGGSFTATGAYALRAAVVTAPLFRCAQRAGLLCPQRAARVHTLTALLRDPKTDGTVFDSRDDWKRHEFATQYTFADRTGERLVRRPGEIDGQPFNLENLTDCEVALCCHSDQVQVDEVRKCRVFIGPSSESIFIRDCRCAL